MPESEVLTNWRNDLSSGIPGMRAVDPHHPLRLSFGSDQLGRPQLTLVTDERPTLPNLSDAVTTTRGQRPDGKWALNLALADTQVVEVFLRLSDDLIQRSGESANEARALNMIRSTLDEWHRLLAPRPRETLTMEELRGLMGEIWLILHHFAASMSVADAITGWLGPMGRPQDFHHPSSGLLEAKAIGPSSTMVKITSENQLDPGDENLLLAVLEVPNAAESDQGAINLPTIVRVLREASEKAGGDINEIDIRLKLLKVRLDHPFYSDTNFVFQSKALFSVTDEFPAIRASGLPGGIRGVRYNIERAALVPFQVESININDETPG